MSEAEASYDVVVVGSGGGGMTAAVRALDLGLSAVVVEKSECYGGTTAISGGGIWIPNSPQAAAEGADDSFEAAMTYVKAAVGDAVPENKLRCYLETGPEMVRYLAERTRLHFRVVRDYPDYYGHLPGAKTGYRTMEPEPVNARLLGDVFDQQRRPSPGTLAFGRLAMTQVEAHSLLSRAPGWLWSAARIFLRYWLDLPGRLRGPRDRRLTLGGALVGALRASLADRNGTLLLNTAFERLVVEDGQVTGIVVRRDGREQRIMARRGVVLAAGGFERNQALRERYLPQPTRAEWSATPPTNTGDALVAAIEVGAAVDGLDRRWGVPTVHVPGEEKQRGIFAERSLPGCVIVNSAGQRFVNEAEPYLEFVDAMHAEHRRSGGGIPAWVVFDADFRRNYAFGPLMPGSMQPDARLSADWLGKVYWRADTLEALAAQIGVDAEGLKATAARMNDYARAGVDPEFHKGVNPIDRFWGDPRVKPNPCLGPIAKPPFYALRLDPGEIGTKGGLVTDEDGRVLSTAGAPIPGLYATGNVTASVMGATYPGPGSTIGPAMVFGYRAANHMARLADNQPRGWAGKDDPSQQRGSRPQATKGPLR